MPERRTHPILLAHGIARFDVVRERMLPQLRTVGVELSDSTHYFRGLKTHLEANGFCVRHGAVSFAAGVETRARELAAEVDRVLKETGARQVHIFAHSMGGLDARHMIVDVPGMAEKVASLTTIGTPHLGTPAADMAFEYGGERLVSGFKSVVNLEGYRDLTTRSCATFNTRALDIEARNGVRYRTCASRQKLLSTMMVMQPTWVVITKMAGPNDGLVPVTSQLWQPELVASDGTRKTVRQETFPFMADHLAQVGWWTPGLKTPSGGVRSLPQQFAKFERNINQVYLELAETLIE